MHPFRLLSSLPVSLTTHANSVEADRSPKSIPWFVSDVLPFDFTWAITSLSNPDFFPSLTSEQIADLSRLSERWQSHLKTGVFKLSVDTDTKLGTDSAEYGFWTAQYAYQDMPAVDPKLVERLSKSGLVIFKGDLNYRK
jgi:hypothetical protein